MSRSGRRELVSCARMGVGRTSCPASAALKTKTYNASAVSRRRWASTNATPRRPRTAIFFPGQGVQRVGMANPWVEAFPRTAKPMLEEIDETLGFSLTKIISEGTNATLNATENSQPAIMATSVLVLRILEKEFGFDLAQRVDFTLGHSLGEFAALVAGGYMEFKDSLLMVRKRGEVMANISRETSDAHGSEVGMVALVCETEQMLQPLIAAIHEFTALTSSGSKYDSVEDVPPVQQVVIANINSKNQIVLSGSITRIHELLTHLRQFGGHDPRHVRLHSDSPFHSPLMKPAQDFMRKYLDKKSVVTGEDMIKWPGVLPCISNVSAVPFKSREELKDLLARQAVDTVRWWDSVRYLDQEEKVRRWIGIGPGKVGRNLVGKEVGMKGKVKGGGVWGITSPLEAEDCMKALDETETYDDEGSASSSTPAAADESKSSQTAPASIGPMKRASTIPAEVRETARQTAAYVFNPAIVQQLWPPPERMGNFNLSGAGQQKLDHHHAHAYGYSDAMFKPASAHVSSVGRVN